MTVWIPAFAGMTELCNLSDDVSYWAIRRRGGIEGDRNSHDFVNINLQS